jgi:ComF family protein
MCARSLCEESGIIDGPEPAAALCDDCREALSKGYSACPCCASRDPVSAADGRCAACRGRRFRFSWALALGTYDGLLREAVLRSKKPSEHCLAAALAELLWQKCGPRLAEFRPDVVAAVPLHWWHRLWRGGNGPDIVCEVLAARLGVMAAADLLARRRSTLPQSNLAQERRRLNVRRAFRVRKSFKLDGARMILVDDILTSGATAHEAAGTLRAAGAAEVSVAAIARADRPA